MKLGEAIISYRERMGISQREFARRCNLSHGTIPILEKGINPNTGKKIVPDMPTYQKIASGMGIPVEELFDMLDKSELVSLGTAMTDNDRLEALHQNPELGMLFDRSRKMRPEDVKFMIQVADRILKGGNYSE